MDNTKEEPKKATPVKPAVPIAKPAPTTATEPKKPSEKPPLTKVLEALTDCKDLEQLEAVHPRTKQYQWGEADLNAIGTGFVNRKKRLHPRQNLRMSRPRPSLQTMNAKA